MLIVTARLNPVLILLVSLVRVSLTFLGGAARTSFLEYIYFLETTSFTCFSNVFARCASKPSPQYIHLIHYTSQPSSTYINMNFVLPIRIAQLILAILVLGTAAYGKHASCSVSRRVALYR